MEARISVKVKVASTAILGAVRSGDIVNVSGGNFWCRQDN
jgi:hypothetical protein